MSRYQSRWLVFVIFCLAIVENVTGDESAVDKRRQQAREFHVRLSRLQPGF